MHTIKHSGSKRKLPVRCTLQTVFPAFTKQQHANVRSKSTVDEFKLAAIKIYIMCACTTENSVRHLSETLGECEAKYCCPRLAIFVNYFSS